jgi:hypothetical protein
LSVVNENLDALAAPFAGLAAWARRDLDTLLTGLAGLTNLAERTTGYVPAAGTHPPNLPARASNALGTPLSRLANWARRSQGRQGRLKAQGRHLLLKIFHPGLHEAGEVSDAVG